MDAARPPLGQDLIWRAEAAGYDLLAWVLGLLPLEAGSNFGGWLLRTLGPLTRQQNVIRTNLRIAFPDRPAAWIDTATKGVWDNVGRSFIELPFVHRIIAEPGRVELIGRDRLDALRDGGKPVILVSGHMGNWEVMIAALLAAGLDVLVAYRSANNPYVDERIRRARAQYGIRRFAPKDSGNMRRLLKSLNDGISIALLTDQRTEEGEAVPFFGKPAHTAPGAARLALKKGAPMVPVAVERLPGVRFRVTVHEPIPPPRTNDPEADVTEMVRRMNAQLESDIRLAPSQYFWVHRRWPKSTYEVAAG